MRPERQIHVHGTGTITWARPGVTFRTTACGALEILRNDTSLGAGVGSLEVTDAFAPGEWRTAEFVVEP